MISYLKNVFNGFVSLVTGMAITLRYAFKKPVTVIYPKERIPMKRFKGPIAFVVDEKNGDHKCIACNACIKTCPSRCMSLASGKSAADGKRVLTGFTVNYMLCSLCSLCIDVCPTDALRHDDPNYDMVSLGQRDLIMDLLKPFRDKKTPLTQIPVADPQPKPAAGVDPVPSGTPAARIIPAPAPKPQAAP